MTSCDELWIEELLNMDDDDDDENYINSHFGEINDYFGDSSTNTLLHHEHINDDIVLGQDQTVKVSDDDVQIHTRTTKRRKVSTDLDEEPETGTKKDIIGQQVTRKAHITVERNRRKQMNQNLSLLRSLMPSFYVKRGDQASIIGGVIDYINELQQLLQSLEAKKQRKLIYNELVLSPRLLSPSPSPSPRKPPLSPRLMLLPSISPRTPQPTSPYNLKPIEHSPSSAASSSTNIVCDVNELAASSKSAMADVEVKFSGQNNDLLLKTASQRIPGQAAKIISALEKLALEILHVSITTIDDTVLNSFTIKIGIECQLSAEELAEHVQQTFC